MWCSNCQQDAPAQATSHPRGYRCLRCAHQIASCAADGAGGTPPIGDRTTAAPHAELSLEVDAWQWQECVQRARRALKSGRRRPLRVAHRRIDPSALVDRAHDDGSAARKQSTRQSWAWIVLAFGFAAFSCGVALLVWGKMTGRQDLQDVGLPTILATQFAILLGLLLAVDSQEAIADAEADQRQGASHLARPHARPPMRRGQRFSNDANRR